MRCSRSQGRSRRGLFNRLWKSSRTFSAALQVACHFYSHCRSLPGSRQALKWGTALLMHDRAACFRHHIR